MGSSNLYHRETFAQSHPHITDTLYASRAILSALTDAETVKPIPFELTLRLVPVRNTNSSHFSAAFVAALRNTLKRDADTPLIDGFKAAFPTAEFPKGA